MSLHPNAVIHKTSDIIKRHSMVYSGTACLTFSDLDYSIYHWSKKVKVKFDYSQIVQKFIQDGFVTAKPIDIHIEVC